MVQTIMGGGAYSTKDRLNLLKASSQRLDNEAVDGQVITVDPQSMGGNYWVQKADYVQRVSFASFSLNGFGYSACGDSGSGNQSNCGQYNDVANIWVARAIRPQEATYPEGFALSAGYVVGSGGTLSSPLCYGYVDSLNSWRRVENIPNVAGNSGYSWGCGVAHNGFGYVHSTRNDAYPVIYSSLLQQYNEAGNAWVQKAFAISISGQPASFSMEGYLYRANGESLSSVIRYDDAINSWVEWNHTNSQTYACAGVALGGLGYCVDGRFGVANSNLSQFNPVTNAWAFRKNDVIARYYLAGFSLNGLGYVCQGRTESSMTLSTVSQYRDHAPYNFPTPFKKTDKVPKRVLVGTSVSGRASSLPLQVSSVPDSFVDSVIVNDLGMIDLSADFSTSINPTISGGFGWGYHTYVINSPKTGNGTNISTFGNYSTGDFGTSPGQGSWRDATLTHLGWAKITNDGAYGATADTYDIVNGDVVTHGPTSIVWRSPYARRRYALTVRTWHIRSIGRTTDVDVWLNDTVRIVSDVSVTDANTRSNKAVVANNLVVTLSAGDYIRVTSGQVSSTDYNGFDVTLRPLPDPLWSLMVSNVDVEQPGIELGSRFPTTLGSDYWVARTPLTIARDAHVGFALDMGYVHAGVVGGSATSSLLKYNDLDYWVEKTSSTNMSSHVSLVLDGKPDRAFVCGFTSSASMYVDSTDAWTLRYPMSVAKIDSNPLSFGGYGYVVGGVTASVATNMVERYNANTNTWSILTAAGTTCQQGAGFTMNGYGYMVAGQRAGSPSSNLQQYDGVTFVAKAPYPSAVLGLRSFKLGDLGYGYCGTAVSTVYQYLDAMNAWVARSANPFVALRPWGFSVNNRGYSVGGNVGSAEASGVSQYHAGIREYRVRVGLQRSAPGVDWLRETQAAVAGQSYIAAGSREWYPGGASGGNYTWTALHHTVVVTAYGGGGGASSSIDGYHGGSGGGGGGKGQKTVTGLTIGAVYNVVVGGGGAGGVYASPGRPGGTGGTTYFNNTSTVCGYGGGGGSQNYTGGTAGSGLGDTVLAGGAGAAASPTAWRGGGGGGSSPGWYVSGNAGTMATVNYGAGGAGGVAPQGGWVGANGGSYSVGGVSAGGAAAGGGGAGCTGTTGGNGACGVLYLSWSEQPAISAQSAITNYVSAGEGVWSTRKATYGIIAGASWSMNGYGYVYGGSASVPTSSWNWLSQQNDTLDTVTARVSGGSANYACRGFGLNGFGYVIGGFDNNSAALSAFLQYNDSTNAISATGVTRAGYWIATFGLNGFGYGFGGQLVGGGFLSDGVQYNDVTNVLTVKASTTRTSNGAFALNGFGYLCMGSNGSVNLSQTLQYSDATNGMLTVATSPYYVVIPVGFVLDGRGYTVNGEASSVPLSTAAVFNDANLTWNYRSPSPYAASGCQGYALNGSGYVLGGGGFSNVCQYGTLEKVIKIAATLMIEEDEVSVAAPYTAPPINRYSYLAQMEMGVDGEALATYSGMNVAVFAGTTTAANDGSILRSINQGATWSNLGVQVATGSIRSTANVGNGVCLAGSGDGRILRSTNYGATWSSLGQLYAGTIIYNLAHIGNGVCLAAAGDGVNGSACRIARSTDYGANWTDNVIGTTHGVTSVLGGLYHTTSNICICGANTKILWSTNLGVTWASIQTIGANMSYSGIYCENQICLTGTDSGRIWRSINSGINWTDLGTMYAQSIIRSLAYVGNGICLAGTANGGLILRSTDYGATWSNLGQQYSQTNIVTLVYVGGGVCLAGTGGGLILRSTDYGATWSNLGQQYSQTVILALAAC